MAAQASHERGMGKSSRAWAALVVLGCAGAVLLYAQRWLPNGIGAWGTSEWPAGYSADFTRHNTVDPARNCTGRLYVNTLAQPVGLRYESVCGDRTRVLLWSGGKEVVLDPIAKAYWEPPTKAHLGIAFQRHGTRESLDGREVERYKMPFPQPDGSTVMTEVWEDVRLHATLRSVSGNEVYQISNIREGAQPFSLFRVPRDYRKVPPPEQ